MRLEVIRERNPRIVLFEYVKFANLHVDFLDNGFCMYIDTPELKRKVLKSFIENVMVKSVFWKRVFLGKYGRLGREIEHEMDLFLCGKQDYTPIFIIGRVWFGMGDANWWFSAEKELIRNFIPKLLESLEEKVYVGSQEKNK
jgi:hypothetical protein